MKEMWQDGTIAYHTHESYNRSGLEKEFFLILQSELGKERVHHKTLRIGKK